MERTHVSFPEADAARRHRAGGLALALIVALAAVKPGTARGQAPADRPGTGAAQASLARYVPKADNLFFLLEFDGLESHQAIWKQSAAYKLLNDTKLGALLEDLAGQVLELAQRSAPPDKRVRPAEALALFKHAANQGFAAGFWGADPVQGGFVIVARRGDRPEVIRLLEQAAAGPADAAPVQKAGRTLHALDPDTSWWIENGDLVISSKPEIVLSVLDGKEPSAVDHPVRIALRRPHDGFEPVAAGFLDITALPPMPPQAAQMGLDGLKRIEIQWGIQDDALLAIVAAVAPRPRRGILTVLDQPTFDVHSLPPLPAGLTGFLVLSLDPARIYEQFVDLTKQTNPQGGEGFAQLEQAFRQRFGFDLRKDVLAQLGPKIAVYSQPPDAAAAANPALAVTAQFTGLTISVQARDESFSKVIDGLVEAINLIIQSQQAAARRGQPAPGGGAIALRKQDGKRSTYVLDLPPGAVPPQFRGMFQPTLVLGKGQLVIAATTRAAEQAAALADVGPEKLWRPADAFVPMARRLPRDLVVLSVSDPRDMLPPAIEGLPIIVAQLNLLFPAVQMAREAARRAQCTNNLKQIGLAMHNYVAVKNTFPAAATTGKDGKPLLSWRVAILPYLEQQPLYDQFHLDEPWDSPHNKALIKEMPQVFVCPDRAGIEPGTTTYRVFTGPGALFEDDRQNGVAVVTDGTANTILAVEAKEAASWTKPDSDLPFDPNAAASLYGAGSPHPGGFQVLLADGSVRFMPDSIHPMTFRALITFNRGEVVDLGRMPLPGPERPERQGGPLHVDASLVPRADELKSLLFPGSLAVVSDRDGVRVVSRESFPSISSPAASGVMVALLLPAVQASREAARRAQCVNNLKQIGLAFANYESVNGAYPRPATIGKDGKPLLSWRVAILPYIEQQELHNKFKLDEPWDSPHNKALIEEMPQIFACPSRARVGPGTTMYRAFVGKGALFEKDRATRIANITDGTSNTIMVVEAVEAVPWTKPDSDLPFDPAAGPSLYGAGSPHPGGFNSLFADGSVRFIKNSINVQVFKALITRAGGEVVNAAVQP